MAEETVKPEPVMVSALTVTAAVPVEEKVTDCVAGELRATPPKAMLATSALSVGPDPDVDADVEAPSCRAKLFVTPFELAVNIAVCAVVTDVVEALKLAVLAPAATVTEAGTVTAEMLLARLIVAPPLGAAALSATVQVSVPAPVIDPLTQLNEDGFAVLVVLAAAPMPAFPISLPPPQPDRITGRLHETRKRRSAGQRQDGTMCARKRELHPSDPDRLRDEMFVVLKLYPKNVLKGLTCKFITLYDLYKKYFLAVGP